MVYLRLFSKFLIFHHMVISPSYINICILLFVISILHTSIIMLFNQSKQTFETVQDSNIFVSSFFSGCYILSHICIQYIFINFLKALESLDPNSRAQVIALTSYVKCVGHKFDCNHKSNFKSGSESFNPFKFRTPGFLQ